MIDDDTGVILMESLDIQYNISGHSGQLSQKKYCCKITLTASSPRISMSGTWGSSMTSMGSGTVLTPSSWSPAVTWGLGVGSRPLSLIIFAQWSSEDCSFWAFYLGKMTKSSKTARRRSTTCFFLKPTLMSFYYIYLTNGIEFFPKLALFSFRSFFK